MEQIKETSLKFSESPLCPIAADVISDGESIYFYMYDLDFENERLIARSACWVKNLVEAPLSFQKDKIDEDHQPVLPAMFVDEEMCIRDRYTDELQEEQMRDDTYNGERLFQKKEEFVILRSWISELPPHLQDVLLLRYDEGLKYRDISQITGIHVSTVKSQVRLALHILKKRAQKEGWK